MSWVISVQGNAVWPGQRPWYLPAAIVNTAERDGGGFAPAYLDDFLVFSEKPEENFDHIQRVLVRLRSHWLKLKLPNCHYLREEKRYMGS